MSKTDPFFDNYAHLRTFHEDTLRDLARNESAPRDYRKFAVELLVVRKSKHSKHPDLREFVDELEIELDGIEFEHPAPSEPLKASVTTSTMFGGDVIDMEQLRKLGTYVDTVVDPNAEVKFTGFDFEIPSPEPPVPPKSRKKKEPDATTG